MADVRVYDQAYVTALEESVVVGGHVNEAGQLVLERGNGEEFNAGQVVAPLDTRWPLGSIYQSFVATDPATLLGGGTWTRLKDRIMIGVGDNPRWDAVGETTGSETITQTVAQMPAHSHGGNTANTDINHTHVGSTSIDGTHHHGEGESGATAFQPTGETGVVRSIMTDPSEGITSDAGGHSHTVGVTGMAEGNGNHHHGINSEGGGSAMDNMPPVQAVFMWRRTA